MWDRSRHRFHGRVHAVLQENVITSAVDAVPSRYALQALVATCAFVTIARRSCGRCLLTDFVELSPGKFIAECRTRDIACPISSYSYAVVYVWRRGTFTARNAYSQAESAKVDKDVRRCSANLCMLPGYLLRRVLRHSNPRSRAPPKTLAPNPRAENVSQQQAQGDFHAGDVEESACSSRAGSAGPPLCWHYARCQPTPIIKSTGQ